MTAIRFHKGDLTDLSAYETCSCVAVDTETLGLNLQRDRLCVVQLSPGDGTADVVQIEKGQHAAPRLAELLTDKTKTKIFHFARFDLAALAKGLGIMAEPVFCTKIASKLIRTYTDRHGLKELCHSLLEIHLSKQQQSSDWGAAVLTPMQLEYAASDVLHLHRLKTILEQKLQREDRLGLAQACFSFLPTRARLDLAGWADHDIFAHS